MCCHMVDIASYCFICWHMASNTNTSRDKLQQLTRKMEEKGHQKHYSEKIEIFTLHVKHTDESLALANLGASQFIWRDV